MSFGLELSQEKKKRKENKGLGMRVGDDTSIRRKLGILDKKEKKEKNQELGIIGPKFKFSLLHMFKACGHVSPVFFFPQFFWVYASKL